MEHPGAGGQSRGGPGPRDAAARRQVRTYFFGFSLI